MKMRKTNIAPATAIVFSEDENYQIHMQRADKPEESVGLWMVTLTEKRVSEDGRTLYPNVSIRYVLAESADGAISQVTDWEDRESEKVTGTATQVPLHVRGWGRQTF